MDSVMYREEMSRIEELITGHEFDRGVRLVLHEDTPCHYMPPGSMVSCGFWSKYHASELSPEQIEFYWPRLRVKPLLILNHKADSVMHQKMCISWEFYAPATGRLVIVDSWIDQDDDKFDVYIQEPHSAPKFIERYTRDEIQEILDNDGGWN